MNSQPNVAFWLSLELRNFVVAGRIHVEQDKANGATNSYNQAPNAKKNHFQFPIADIVAGMTTSSDRDINR